MAYDLLHGDEKSVHLVHYGTKGMRWGVRKAVKGRLAGRQAKVAKQISKEAASVRKEAKSLDAKSEGHRQQALGFIAAKPKSDRDARLQRSMVGTARNLGMKAAKKAEKKHSEADTLDAEAKSWSDTAKRSKKAAAAMPASNVKAKIKGLQSTTMSAIKSPRGQKAVGVGGAVEGIVKMLKMVAHDKDAYDLLVLQLV